MISLKTFNDMMPPPPKRISSSLAAAMIGAGRLLESTAYQRRSVPTYTAPTAGLPYGEAVRVVRCLVSPTIDVTGRKGLTSSLYVAIAPSDLLPAALAGIMLARRSGRSRRLAPPAHIERRQIFPIEM